MPAPRQGRSGLVELMGTRLYYETAGLGLPVVLIHGFANDTRAWDFQFEPFARRHQVLRYDLRGFGQSALPGGEEYSHADDLRALLDHLEIPVACLVGHSMGGDVALAFSLACPRRVRALVLLDSTLWGFPWSTEWRNSLREVSRAAREAGIEKARNMWADHPLFRPALERPELTAEVRGTLARYSGWHWVNRDPVRQPDPPTARQLDRIGAPVLVLAGERDLPDFQAVADLLHQGIRGARKLVLPNVGHLPNLEGPEEFNEAVLGFLSGVGKALP